MITERPAEGFLPGDFLDEELEARGWTQVDLASITGIPAPRISEIVKGKTSIAVSMALAFSKAFETSPEYWVNLQSQYDLWLAIVDDSNGKES